jgi:hypothetical protein
MVDSIFYVKIVIMIDSIFYVKIVIMIDSIFYVKIVIMIDKLHLIDFIMNLWFIKILHLFKWSICFCFHNNMYIFQKLEDFTQ